MPYELQKLFDKSRLKKFKKNKNYYLRGVSAFQLDYSSIIFSSAFRHLLDKTQVFPLEKYDYVRTRLTHSLEVMAIFEEIINKLTYNMPELKRNRFSLKYIARTAALVHDLGNPPYGHYGEAVIRKFFIDKQDSLALSTELRQMYNFSEKEENTVYKIIGKTLYYDFTNFNGNAQTLRMLTSLKYINAKPCGFNLTCGLLGSIIKYPCYSSKNKNGKVGIFRSEEGVANALEEAGTLIIDEVNPIARLLEASDDIAYIFSDIDDAVKKDIITQFDFVKELESACKKDKDGTGLSFFKDIFDRYLKKSKDAHEPFKTAIQETLNTARTIVINVCVENIVKSQSFTSQNKEILSNIKTHQIYGKSANELINFLKLLMKKYVYVARPIIENELEGENILLYLLEEFTNAVLKVNIDKNGVGKPSEEDRKANFHEYKIYSFISSHIRKTYGDKVVEFNDGKIDASWLIYHRLQMVVDYISGMTDSYAKIMYKKLKGID